MKFADILADLAGASDIAAARRRLADLFERAHIDSPALDARLLIQKALSLDHTALASEPKRTLSENDRDTIAQLAARRLSGEPVARILGVKEFWGLKLSLSKATLVPRPETETVVELALASTSERRNEPVRVADLGTGTGAILLALLTELPNATGIGTDLDAGAIETAQANASALGLSSRAQFVRTDFGSGLTQAFDLVVSNPPYVATGEIAALATEVREHDPLLALDGGGDGLDAYRALAAQMPSLLNTNGVAVLEIGIGQAAPVEAIFSAAGLRLTATKADLAGIPRALTFRRGDSTQPRS
jgi:release factor glutamine methyltransferase